jgi:hypothetical protein
MAQNDRGVITGTVLDQANAVVGDAAITGRNVLTGAIYETRSTSAGNYILSSLPPGTYDITATAPGFSKFLGTGTQVQVSQTIHLDITLQVGAVTDSITVDATAPLLKSESNEQSIVVSRDQYTSLPLAGTGGSRIPRSFMILSPGVSGAAAGQSGRVNGQPGNTQRIFIDGQDSSNTNNNGINTGPPPQEMIQEFSLQTSNFSAEYGQVQGGVFSFATRSGTNSIRGGMWEYWQNDALDAARPFAHTKALSRRNDFGFNLGGPVYIPKIYNGRNKTFFFLNFEEAKNSQFSSTSFSNLPTPAMRGGDFSASLTNTTLTGKDPSNGNANLSYRENTIFDPLTTKIVNGSQVRTAFPGNIIPSSRLDPVALKIQALIPLPDLPGVISNWTRQPSFRTYSVSPAIKIDHNLSAAQKLSFYVHHPTNLAPNNVDGLPLPISGIQNAHGNTWISRLNYDYTITPTIVFHAGAGLLRFLNPASSPDSVINYDAAGLLGFTGSAIGTGFPAVRGLNSGTGGGMALNVGPTGETLAYYTKLTAPASVTYVRGNHTYKLGGEWRLESFTDKNLQGTGGILNFSATETSQTLFQGQTLSGGSLGLPYASFLLGAVNNATVQSPQDLQWRNMRWGLYIQDTWKATRKLTIDYGIRWDLQDQGHEIHDRNSMFGPSVPNPSAGGKLGAVVYEGYGAGRCNCKFSKTYPYAIGPRLGFAYQLDSKTVIRGGWGVVYAGLATFNSFTTQPVIGVGINTVPFTSTVFGTPALTLKNGLQYDPSLLTAATLDPGLRPTAGTLTSPNYFIDPNANRPGRIHTFSINIQREITKNLVIEAAYVGNRGVWLIGATGLVNLNALSDAKLTSVGLNRLNPSDQSLLISTFASGKPQAAGFSLPYASFPTGSTLAQSLRPFPQFSSAFNPMWAPLGSNWYDSLQAKATHRFSHGLSAVSNFTYSKELATGQAINDVFNRPNQKSLVSSSQPFLFTVAFTYQVPTELLGVHNKFLNQVIGNWTVGGLLRYSSGLPIAVPGSTGNLNSLLFQSTRFNRVPGVDPFLKDLNCHCIDPSKDLVLNKAAWAEPAAGQWGTSAPFYGDYRAQRTPSEQLSLARIFRLKDRYSLEVRGEFFNVFNRMVLPGPTSGNPLATTTSSANGLLTGGFGFINYSGTGGQRTGQMVARLQF